MDGNIYHCVWEKVSDGYLLALKNSPNIKAFGTSFDTASMELAITISELEDDGEPQITYDPPRPVEESLKINDLDYCFALGPMEFVHAANRDMLFDNGYCLECGNPIGHRTTASIAIDFSYKSDVCSEIKSHAIVVSKRFKVFLDQLGVSLKWRECEQVGKKPLKCLFELLSNSTGVLERLNSNDFERITGISSSQDDYICPKCSRHVETKWALSGIGAGCVRGRTISQQLSEVFIFSDGWSNVLGVSRKGQADILRAIPDLKVDFHRIWILP